MRVNAKRLTIISVVLLLIWLVVMYSSFVDGPKSSGINTFNIENRLNKLKQQMDEQLTESNMLLDKIKSHLKKTGVTSSEIKYNQDVKRSDSGPVLPVLIIACDRVTVQRCIDNLIKYRPNKHTFPIIISQDCGHNDTYNVIKSYTRFDDSITVVRQPDLTEIPLPRAKAKFRGYYNIARHYKFALHHVLVELGYDAVIIVEDDLDISSDFFEYFLGTYPLLEKDPSIWCISAWNDNGKKDLTDLSRPDLLHRTDFFPGLGWMLQRWTWLDLEPNWPQAFFDDWLRDPKNTGSRSCIRPEISRTFSFGKVGVSKGLFFDMHLKYIQLNSEYVPFTKLNLTYLLKDAYDATLRTTVSSLRAMSAEEVLSLPLPGGKTGPDAAPVRVPYVDAKTFRKAAKKLGLMDDFRSGIPRTAYRGVVTCHKRGRRVYIAPDYLWVKYDSSWS